VQSRNIAALVMFALLAATALVSMRETRPKRKVRRKVDREG
jgi:hypothetical protein